MIEHDTGAGCLPCIQLICNGMQFLLRFSSYDLFVVIWNAAC